MLLDARAFSAAVGSTELSAHAVAAVAMTTAASGANLRMKSPDDRSAARLA
jgi:hypothetical protein